MNFIRVSKFGSITGISRKALIFYDKQKLISPEKVSDNSYRYYSFGQIDTAMIIKTLSEMGIPLKEVRDYLNKRSPDNIIHLLEKRKDLIEQEMIRLERIYSLINKRLELTYKGRYIEPGKIECGYFPEEKLFLGPDIPETESLEEAWEYLSEFHETCIRQEIEFGRPIGCIIKREFLTIKGYHLLSNYYYTLNNDDIRANFLKPAGLYVIGYEYTSYGQTDALYSRIKKYINDNGLNICGDIYTEYILDEVVMQNPKNYLAQVAIQVEKAEIELEQAYYHDPIYEPQPDSFQYPKI
ncbi:putative transcriptional regulator [Desulfitobacterium dehalogenans ATCC 51507]|uniref:Putative transcriptional regulator n=1 Tax=Desulfitobacterium dehalogenans (strain ATCC 51507 / DSM 9161 / JW/IU-DC1) TaxID=756499 RepID=I4A496_DESDJ|nr:MerR family transcriptional regulator [Desulfitobacterium dehalogenans]AFL98780.1 putative transcriptional regulator [Desulfitobacterium dehalogenans ATCC 51507]